MSKPAVEWASASGGGGSSIHRPLGDVPFNRKPGVPHVYVMTLIGTPYLKVGASSRVSIRRASLRGPLDMDIRYVREVHGNDEPGLRNPDIWAVEAAAHELLAPFQHRNEWFTCDVATARLAINDAVQIARERADYWNEMAEKARREFGRIGRRKDRA